MRGNAARALAIAFALAAAAAPSGAFVEGVLVGNGDKITTAVDDVGDTDAFTVGAGAGGKISVTAAAAKGSFVLPVLRLFDNAGAEVDVALLLKGAGTKKVSLKNFPVPAGGTGEWTVLVSGGSTFGGYTASFKVADPKTVVRKGLLVPDGQEVAIPVPTAAGATLSGKVKILAGTAPETLLFRADAAAGGGTALLQPSFTAARGLPVDVPVESRTRQLSSVALVKNGGAGDCTLDLTVKVKTPKVVKRKVFLPPEGGVAGVAPGIVRQEQAPVLTLDGVFVHGEPSPRIYATLPGEDAEDAGVGVTASGFSGVTSTDPDSGVVLSPGATATLAVAADAAYGVRDLVYVPPPLLGEPNRLAGALVVRAPVPTVLSVSPASLRQEGTSILLTVTGTGFRTGGALSFSGAGIVAGATTVVDATTAEVTVSVDADAAVGLRDVTFTQPVQGGGSSGTGTGVLTVRNPIPSVASAAPATLRQEDAGVVVAFAGTGFRAGGTLSVSGTGVSAGAATVVNGNQVTVPLTVAFDAAIGPRSATWTQPAAGGGDAATGTDVLTIQFPTPTVTSASPAFVRQLDAAKVVTVTGTGFRAGGVLAISGAGLALGATTVVNATTATVAVTVDEFAAVGARDVTFTQAAGGGGASGTRTSGLSVFHPVPTLTSFTPTTVVQGTSGISVVLTGQRFRDGGVVSAGSGMTFTGGTRDSDTQFTVTLAVGSLATLGLRDLVYTQPAAGGSDAATKANSLQVNAPDPTVTAIDVATVKQNDAAVARFLTGTNFRSGGTVTVSGTGVTVGGVVVTSSTRVDFNLTVTNGAAIGPRNVTWTQPASGGGAAATLTNGLTVNFPDPTVTSASPSQIDREATNLTLTLTGTNFRAGGTVSISGTEVTLSSPAHVNDTTFTVLYSVSATAALGLRNLTYTHTGGGGASATKTNAVEVMPVGVDLSSLAPSAWIPGTSRFRCVATGANFNSGTSTSVSGSGVTVHGTIFVSSTKLDLELSVDSSAALGARDVTITPGAGGGSPKTFTGAAVVAVAPPRVASFSAPALSQGASSVAVVVLGSGFLTGDTLAASGSGVTFSSVTVVNEGKITATAAVDGAAATGNRDVTVTRSAGNGGLADSLSPAFQVVGAAPTLTAVNPSKVGRTGSGGATREVPIVLTGTNFMTGATLSVTKTSASGVSVVSSSEVVLSSTEMRATLSVTGTATTGTWDLQVANPGSLGNSGSGGAGLLDVKDENTLCVHRVIASSGTAFGGERVTVHGSGFAAGVVVDFGSVRAPGTLFMDKGTLVTTVPMPATQSRTSPAIVDVKVTKTDASNATLTGGYAYAKDDGEFRVTGAFPAQGATGVPKNLVSTVIRLSYPADTTTGTYGTTTGTNVFWFESSGSFVSSALRGFGPGGRFLVLSRTGGGNLPIASAGTYVRDIPVTLTSLGGNPLSVQRIASVTHDQYSFTISSSATDTTAPTLSSISPADTANPVDVTTKVTIVFSEEIDPLTVNATNITFKQGSTVIGADMAMADDLRTVTITPHAVLAASQTFTTNVTASVKDLFGNAYTNTSYTFTTGNGTDGTPAVVDAVILEGLPADMDGSGTFVNSSGTGGNAFDAYLPQDGWLVDVRFSDEGGSGVDASKFSAKASVAVAGNSANAELASNFSVTPTGATWRIPSSGFAAGDNATFTFTITDLANNTAGSKTVTFDVVSKDATASGAGGGDHDPFDARRTWILRGDLDAYTATYSTATSPNRQGATTTVATSNVPDLDEALRLVGLNTASMTTDASNAVNGNDTGTNAILRRLFMERLREAMRERYHITEDGVHGADSVDVEFLLPGEQGSLSSMPTFSTANSSSSTKAFSELSVGGTLGADASAFSAAGTLGQAWLDPRNRGEEANLNFGAGGNITGLYLMGMLKLQVNGGTGTVFGSRISAKLVAIHGGTPAGENSLDDDVLAGSFDRTNGGNSAAQNTRYDEIMDAVELIALYTSAVGAHEVGHSTGLVPDGAPKTGLFGNAHFNNTFTEATSVTPNTSAHLDFLGNDIMAASTGFESGVTTGADFKRFSPMDVAYLRNRLVHDEGK
jgi:hypothetical protein